MSSWLQGDEADAAKRGAADGERERRPEGQGEEESREKGGREGHR